MSLLLLAALARAEPELPSYREEVVVAAWTAMDDAITRACRWPEGQRGVGAPLACSELALDRAIDEGRAFERQVTPDARIRYLTGLATRHRGDLRAAERLLGEAVALDPGRAEAWFDLGELRAGRQDWAGAAEAFARVTALVPTGPRAWPGWLQRAQIAALQGDAAAFEHHLREALRHGFTFRMIVGQPAWRGFWADPRIQPTLEQMLSVYASEDVRESLETP